MPRRARMTGGGFGGCVVALVPDGRVSAVGEGGVPGVCVRPGIR